MKTAHYTYVSLVSGVLAGAIMVFAVGVPQGVLGQTVQPRESAVSVSANIEMRKTADKREITTGHEADLECAEGSSAAHIPRVNKAELIDAIAKGSKLTAVSAGSTPNEVVITIAEAEVAQKGGKISVRSTPQGGYCLRIPHDDVRDAILEILQDEALVARGIEKKDIWRGVAEVLDAGAHDELVAPQARVALAEAAQAIQRVIIHEGTKDPNQNTQQRVIIHEGTKDPHQPTQQRVIIHEGTKDPKQNTQTKRAETQGGGSYDLLEEVAVRAELAPGGEGSAGEAVVVNINALERADGEAKAQARARLSSIDAVTSKNDLGMFLALTALEDPHIVSMSVGAPAQENGKEKPSVVVATRGEANAQANIIDSVLGSGGSSALVVDTEVRVLGVFKKKARAQVEAKCTDDGSNCTTSIHYDLPWYLRLISWEPSLSAYTSLSAQVVRKAAQLEETATKKAE